MAKKTFRKKIKQHLEINYYFLPTFEFYLLHLTPWPDLLSSICNPGRLDVCGRPILP
jgi:hypothetical protein